MNTALLLGIFFIGCVYGFIYETLFYYINDGWWVRRGTSFGPFIQIYGFGGLFIYLICKNRKFKPWTVAIISGVLSGVLEYVVGWWIYTFMDGLRPWDYNTEIWNWGNIDGFVCFRSVAVFAVSGVMLMFVILPVLMWVKEKIGRKAFFYLMFIPGIICAVDVFYNDVLTKIVPLMNAQTFWHNLGWHCKELLGK